MLLLGYGLMCGVIKWHTLGYRLGYRLRHMSVYAFIYNYNGMHNNMKNYFGVSCRNFDAETETYKYRVRGF